MIAFSLVNLLDAIVLLYIILNEYTSIFKNNFHKYNASNYHTIKKI